MDKAKLIKEYAFQVGFDLCGITTAEPFSQLEEFLHNRQQKGWRSEFEVKEIQQRINPQLVFPEARSIIALAKAFPSCSEKLDVNTGKVKIARCGWGIDYHLDFRELMEAMEEFLRNNFGASTKAMVDTGPLLDREVAARAGLGWYGRNCSIISSQYGSWIALGEILVDLDLTPDKPVQEDCGECRRCILACPTGALTEPYKVNPTVCLSQLTQTKTILAPKQRKLLGNRLYGCDTCQDVCPQNRHKQVCRTKVSVNQTALEIEELLSLSKSQFQNKYGSSAFAWRGKNLLQRNAIIALGNSAEPEAVPLLVKALQSPSAMLRGYSTWSLGQIGSSVAMDSLKAALKKEQDPFVLDEIRSALDRK